MRTIELNADPGRNTTMLRHHAFLTACLTLLLSVTTATASPADSRLIETSDFRDAVNAIENYLEFYGASRVLLVVDIDNTLLATNSSLGSDQWFQWQEYLLKHEPDSPALVAKDYPGLLRVQGLLFSLGSMRTTDPSMPGQISGLQKLGVPTLVLTSRGPGFRDATERELTRNGLHFDITSLPAPGLPRGVFQPYSLQDLAPSGLSKEEADAFRLAKPKNVSYANGVFMTSGQHKGAMLLTMLARSPQPIEAVVFIDDHGRHVARVYDALVRREIAVTAVHYKKEDPNVQRFQYGDKSEVIKNWRTLEQAIDTVFDQPKPPAAVAP